MRKSKVVEKNSKPSLNTDEKFALDDEDDVFVDDNDDALETEKFITSINGCARRKLEELMEQKSLKKMIDDDYYNFE
jgi:hypothetical protein